MVHSSVPPHSRLNSMHMLSIVTRMARWNRQDKNTKVLNRSQQQVAISNSSKGTEIHISMKWRVWVRLVNMMSIHNYVRSIQVKGLMDEQT